MNDMILILNYSDEFAVEAARRLRGEQVFCKIISGMTTAAQIAQAAPRGIVLCGEPQSAAGVFDAEILKLGIPVLALGHAAHMLIMAMGVSGGIEKANKIMMPLLFGLFLLLGIYIALLPGSGEGYRYIFTLIITFYD